MPYVTTCSYCSDAATHIGRGTDGDLYCDAHLGKSRAGTYRLDDFTLVDSCTHRFIDDTTGRCSDCDTRMALLMTDLTMRWHARDDGLMHYGYDADLPGGARVYLSDGRWRCTTIVNAMDIADVDIADADAPIDKVLAYASDAVSAALVARKAAM